MAIRKHSALRTADLDVGIFFKSYDQGGLERPMFHSSVKLDFDFSPHVVATQGHIWVRDGWLTPGDRFRTQLTLPSWRDIDRAQVAVGTSFDVIQRPNNQDCKSKIIGLGVVIEVLDPNGRRFVADAEATLKPNLSSYSIEAISHRVVTLLFPRIARTWTAHFDIKNPEQGSGWPRRSGNAYLCFHNLGLNFTEYPDLGHPLQIEDAFQIIDGESDIGSGTVARWIDHREQNISVCEPKGWRWRGL
jgi:hypothetical protein